MLVTVPLTALLHTFAARKSGHLPLVTSTPTFDRAHNRGSGILNTTGPLFVTRLMREHKHIPLYLHLSQMLRVMTLPYEIHLLLPHISRRLTSKRSIDHLLITCWQPRSRYDIELNASVRPAMLYISVKHASNQPIRRKWLLCF